MPSVRERIRDRFRALRHRNFRLFWNGQLISLVGTWMQSVGQGWLMHRLTDSPWMLGVLGFAQFLPVTALSLWAGVVVDRVDKRRLDAHHPDPGAPQAAVLRRAGAARHRRVRGCCWRWRSSSARSTPSTCRRASRS